mmetsp:Transcript_8363/g.18268  ORF Transcript_8363/g.18268 Transcript_8363/m.18268 type:complete len:126 (+) Transcript_8363:223-600(+)
MASPVPVVVRKTTDSAERERQWLERTTRRLTTIDIGRLPSSILDDSRRVMDSWAKQRSKRSALMVEKWLKRVMDEEKAGNSRAKATTVMYTMVRFNPMSEYWRNFRTKKWSKCSVNARHCTPSAE